MRKIRAIILLFCIYVRHVWVCEDIKCLHSTDKEELKKFAGIMFYLHWLRMLKEQGVFHLLLILHSLTKSSLQKKVK